MKIKYIMEVNDRVRINGMSEHHVKAIKGNIFRANYRVAWCNMSNFRWNNNANAWVEIV